MPTYDYICENCGYDFEHFQSITARPLRRCPKCRKNRLKRLIGSGAGILFKGNGFYQTDYRTESYKKAQKDEKSTTDTDTKKEKTQPRSKTKNSHSDAKTKTDTTSDKKSP